MSHLNSPAGVDAIVPLSHMMTGEDRVAGKAAGEELNRVVHHAARPGASAEAKAASMQLVKLIGKETPRMVRSEALRLLGLVAGAEAVPAIAAQLSDTDIREDARMALERIPGRAAEAALRGALKTTPADYHPAIQQSLRHRSVKFREVGIAKS